MKTYFKFDNKNLKIIPKGWLKDYLIRQKEGLTGHIEKAGEPFKSFNWNKYDMDEINKMDPIWRWVPFEQTAYYLDGAVNLGNLLDDKELKEKTDKIIYDTFKNIDSDHYIGPTFLKDTNPTLRWQHTVFFRAVIAKYYENKDIKLIKKIEEHYLNDKALYVKNRNVTNIEIMLLVYEITKNKALLELAIKSYKGYQENIDLNDPVNHYTSELDLLDNNPPYEHGVTYNEISKLGAILYAYTGNKDFLKPTVNAYKKLEKYHLLPDGCISSNEFLRGKKANETHETCDISDFSWSLGYLLKTTKNGHYADLIERCILNAGIGATLENFKALQYFSGLNQVVLDRYSNHNFYRRGMDWMMYRPEHAVQCCSGNVNRIMPNYASRMYMRNRNTIYSIFYSESSLELKINRKKLIVNQDTNYPFNETIKFSFSGDYDNFFNYGLRIPSWADSYKVLKNGKEIDLKINKGFVIIKDLTINDKLELSFESSIKVKKYQSTGVIVEKGPLLYSLGMKGKRSFESNNDPDGFNPYNIYADKDWNYGIDVNDTNIEFINKNVTGYPWDLDYNPLSIRINAYKIPSLTLVKKKKVETSTNEFKKMTDILKGDFKFTPNVKSYKSGYTEKDRIELYPFASSKLRISVFPLIKKNS